MQILGLTSRYARLGIFTALGCLLLAGVLPDHHAGPTVSYQLISPQSTHHAYNMDVVDFSEDTDIELFRSSATVSDREPCFDVAIDTGVPGYDEAYRSDLFGDTYIVTQDELIKKIEAGLTTSFLDRTWEMDQDCFAGSFVVSFDVTEEGTLGRNMLVHHLRGGSNNAAFAIMKVLWEMERSGHTWHDGTQGAGEIRLPVSFRLL